MWKRAVFAAGAAVATAAVFAWTRPAAADRDPAYTLTGVVVAPPDGQIVRIRHEAIPGYMPGMTMAFTLDGDEPASVTPGDLVRFTFRPGSGGIRAEGLQVIGHAEAGEPPTAAPVARLKRGDRLPSFTLLDDDGRAFTDRDLRGRPTVLSFIFTRCPVPEFCPLVTQRFRELQDALAHDPSGAASARLLSITLDPEFDTPPVLQAFARSRHADPARWRFAGGESDEVLRLARAFSVYVERQGALLDHTLATALVDADGVIREIWRGNGWSAADVMGALHARPTASLRFGETPQAPGVEHLDVRTSGSDETGRFPFGKDAADSEQRGSRQLGKFLPRQRVGNGEMRAAGGLTRSGEPQERVSQPLADVQRGQFAQARQRVVHVGGHLAQDVRLQLRIAFEQVHEDRARPHQQFDRVARGGGDGIRHRAHGSHSADGIPWADEANNHLRAVRGQLRELEVPAIDEKERRSGFALPDQYLAPAKGPVHARLGDAGALVGRDRIEQAGVRHGRPRAIDAHPRQYRSAMREAAARGISAVLVAANGQVGAA
jgi:protein SCO1/2